MNSDPSAFDLTQWLPDDVRDAFHMQARRSRFSQGELIYSQGDTAEAMYRLVSGAVRLSVARSDGRELLYILFKPGDCFGVSSLIDGEPLPQTAEAAEEVEVEVMGRSTFARFRADHREFDDALLRLVTRHMRLLSGFFADSHLEDMSARIASRILTAANSFGHPEENGIGLSIALTQSELARMVGGSRQTVNKVLQQFRLEGLIGSSGGRLIIVSPEGLKSKLVMQPLETESID